MRQRHHSIPNLHPLSVDHLPLLFNIHVTSLPHLSRLAWPQCVGHTVEVTMDDLFLGMLKKNIPTKDEMVGTYIPHRAPG